MAPSPRRRALSAWLVLAGVLVTLLAWPGAAAADSSARVMSPRIVLTTTDGARGPLRLTSRPAEGAAGTVFEGEFVIANRGDAPLMVTRIAPRGDEDDVRLPPRLSIRYADGTRGIKTGDVESTAASIAPGGARHVRVTGPQRRRARHAARRARRGHLERRRRRQSAMGIRADRPRPLGFVTEHPLAYVLLLPLLGALLVAALPLIRLCAGLDPARKSRSRAGHGAVTELRPPRASTSSARSTGRPRAFGQRGYQFIERRCGSARRRRVLRGVDGLSVGPLLLGSVVAFTGGRAGCSGRERTRGYFALYLVLSAAMTGVFLALDLILFFVLWEVMLFAIYLLVRLWGRGGGAGVWGEGRGEGSERAASKFLVVALVGSAALAIAIVALHHASARTFLVDGTPAAHSYALPELMRVAYNTRGLSILGFPFVKVAWVLLFVGFAVTMPLFPFHTYLPDLVAAAPAPVSAAIAGAVLKTGLYGVLRVGFAVLPEGCRWASGTVVAFGVVGVAYGAFAALSENDLKRFVAYASLSHAGLALVGIGSLTPPGSPAPWSCRSGTARRRRSCSSTRSRSAAAPGISGVSGAWAGRRRSSERSSRWPSWRGWGCRAPSPSGASCCPSSGRSRCTKGLHRSSPSSSSLPARRICGLSSAYVLVCFRKVGRRARRSLRSGENSPMFTRESSR